MSTTESCLTSPTIATSASTDKNDGPSDELFRMVLGNKSSSVEKILRRHSDNSSGVGGEGVSENSSSETEISQYGHSMFYSAKDKDNCDGRCFAILLYSRIVSNNLIVHSTISLIRISL